MKRKLIALVGMAGSGKTEAIEYLQKKYNWPKVYFGQVTLDEVARLGLEINEKNERFARESLRDRYGEDHHAREIAKKIEELGEVPIVLVESLYSFIEYKVLKEHFGDELILIAVHASPGTRYARLAARPTRPLTKEEALSRDLAQLDRLDQGSPIALADFVVINEKGRQELQDGLDRIIQSIQ